MITFGMIVTVVMGFLIVVLISTRFSWMEKIGLSFPVGMGVQTMIMALLDLFGLRLTAFSVLSAALVAVLVLSLLLFRRLRQEWAHPRPIQGLHGTEYNLVWLLFVGLTVYFEYMNFVKCMYFPTFDRDSLAGFDTIGYVIAQEHTFRHISLFQADYMPQIHHAGSYITYAPMTQLSYAFVYLLGAETSKPVPAWMYLFFLVVFYGALKRVSGHTCAAVATFFTLVTPEMIAFSSLSATNVIHAVSASLGIIYIALWVRFRFSKDLLLGSLLLGLNVWTRTDGIVFVLAAWVVVGFVSFKDRQWYKPVPPLCALVPALFWMLFCKLSHFYAESIVITHFFWDADKVATIWAGITSLCTDRHFYGISFLFFVFSLVCNGWFVVRKKDNLPLLGMMLMALACYMAMLYQIDYKWDSIHHVLAYSAKRFLFCFIPPVWFHSMSNRWIIRVFGKLGKTLG